MKTIFIPALILISGLSACKKADDKQIETAPTVNIAPGREPLHQANELEKKMQDDAEARRKVVEVQSQ